MDGLGKIGRVEQLEFDTDEDAVHIA